MHPQLTRRSSTLKVYLLALFALSSRVVGGSRRFTLRISLTRLKPGLSFVTLYSTAGKHYLYHYYISHCPAWFSSSERWVVQMAHLNFPLVLCISFGNWLLCFIESRKYCGVRNFYFPFLASELISTTCCAIWLPVYFVTAFSSSPRYVVSLEKFWQ